VAAAVAALALVGDDSPAQQPVAKPPVSTPVDLREEPAPTTPSPTPARTPVRTPVEPEARRAVIVPTAVPTPSVPPRPAPTPTPAPAPAPTATATSAPSSSPTPPPAPTRTPPPAPVVYELSELSFDLNGDGTRPEIRLAGSSWVWQRSQLSIAGRQYARGVTVHGDSSVTVDLNRACISYDALVGVDDLTTKLGKVTFSVHADGVRLWTSGVMKGGDAAVPVHVDLAGRESVRLVVEPHSHFDSLALADWAESRFTCS
ncbi:NPCBM/NEW2 domain-containing protein, partial [Streptomyces sp. A012304]|uniref:NPCBM/NEW2 domain-containing protein n=1 Tax=Streptomyces sp. A012304 TaxID=375446 RepID=UPI0022305A59